MKISVERKNLSLIKVVNLVNINLWFKKCFDLIYLNKNRKLLNYKYHHIDKIKV